MAQTSSLNEIRRSCKCFPHVNKIITLTYNRANSVLFKNTITLKMMHDIFNFHDPEVIICIILVLERMASTILNIRQTTFNPKSNSQYHMSSPVCNWQHTFQQGVKFFWYRALNAIFSYPSHYHFKIISSMLCTILCITYSVVFCMQLTA